MARNNKQMSSKGLFFFGLFWTAFSSIFLILGLKTTYDSVNRSGWPQTECKVVHFKVKAAPNQDPAFQPVVEYHYDWEGESFTGDQVWASQKGEDDYEDLGELIEQHRAGKLNHCYVNPEDPGEAVLIAGGADIWGGVVFTIFGGGFVAIGVGLMFGSRRMKKKDQGPLSSKAGSPGQDDEAPKAIMIPFFAIFALAGLGTLIFLVIPQAQKYQAAKGWKETKATVIWSRVQSHSSDDGTTYSVDIFYRYQFGGKKYKSNTLGFFSSSSSGRSSKQEKVDDHPKGKQITCYVNPEKPWQALLERDLGWSALFALFPLPFLAIGVGGLWWTLRKRSAAKKALSAGGSSDALGRRTSSLRHAAGVEDVYHAGHGGSASLAGQAGGGMRAASGGEKTFSPGGGRVKGLIGSLVFTLFWNGIVSVFVTIAVKSWLAGKPEWFLTLFIIPFVLIGLAALLYTFYTFLTLFNPSPKLVLNSGAVTLGRAVELMWRIPSKEQRLKKFSLYLIGEEVAEYRRGTNTVTDTSVFYEELLFETSDPRQAKRGSTMLNLPVNTVPSWKSKHNQIKWSLVVKGEIALWPDVSDTYPVEVLAADLHS